MSTIIHTVGGVPVAFGLTWVNLAAARNVQDELRTTAKHKRYSHGIVFQTEQFAYGGYVVGATVPKAAKPAVLALPRDEDLIAYYPLGPDSAWLARVQRHGFDTKSVDQVVPIRAAVALIEQWCGDWASQGKGRPRIVAAPGAVAPTVYIEDAERMELADLLGQQIKTAAPLVSLTDPPLMRFLVRGIAVLCVVVIGGRWAMDEYNARRKAVEAATQQEAQAADLFERQKAHDAAEKNAIAAALTGDTATPSPQDTFNACWSVAQQLGSSFGGWHVVGVDCTAAGWSATLVLAFPSEPTYGDPATLQTAAASIGATASVASDLHQASLSGAMSVPRRPAVATVEALPRVADLQLRDAPAWLSAERSDLDLRFHVDNASPKNITFADPADLGPDHRPKNATVDPSKTYRETPMQFTATYPWRTPIQTLDRTYITLDAVTISTGERPTTNLRLRALSRP